MLVKDIVFVWMNSVKFLNVFLFLCFCEFDDVLSWYDDEFMLCVLVIIGIGCVFIVGVDLCEWWEFFGDIISGERFGQRKGVVLFICCKGVKFVIVVVNGFVFGGGCEFVVNCDIVIVLFSVMFGFLEVYIGLVFIGGVFICIVYIVGMQIVFEIVFIG